jgi:hypothetical protein
VAASVVLPTSVAIWLIAATAMIPFSARLTLCAIGPAKSSVWFWNPGSGRLATR